jgi:chaperonin cofactor prefoldin
MEHYQAKSMDEQKLRERIEAIASKRASLEQLLEQPNLGTLRIDVNQALEEIDDLIDEFNRTFPEQPMT